jgi:hypothetical protein
MGDSGEGLIDAESRIQERMEEMQANREKKNEPAKDEPERFLKLGSLNLVRTQLTRQLEIATHENRRKQLTGAITDIDRQIAELREDKQK